MKTSKEDLDTMGYRVNRQLLEGREQSAAGAMLADGHVDRLIKALALHRDEYTQGKIDSLTWIRARKMVMREAAFLGVTDMLLRGGKGTP